MRSAFCCCISAAENAMIKVDNMSRNMNVSSVRNRSESENDE